MSTLVGKTKYSINSELWGAPARTGQTHDIPEVSYSFEGMSFLRRGEDGFVNKDTLKIALGKAWTEDFVTFGDDGLVDKSVPPALTNDELPFRMFYGQPLEFKGCGTSDAVGSPYPGFLKNSIPDENFDPPVDNPNKLFLGYTYIESISVGVGDLDYYSSEDRHAYKDLDIPTIDHWAAFIKLGLITNDGAHHPIASNATTGGGGTKPFRDHVFKTANPFSSHEMCSKQPFGKAAQASMKTYYNTAYDSKEWESFIANLGVSQYHDNADIFGYGKTHLFYNNALPTPYGLLRIMLNKFEVNELYKPNYHDLGPGMKPHKWYGTSFNIGNFHSEDRTAFIKYPYELLMTFFGRIPPDKVSKIAHIKPKTQNVQDQFEDYFNSYMTAFQKNSTYDVYENSELRKAVDILDTVFDNVAISPNVLKNLDKVHQIKKYFPFYAEAEFSTQQYTELGDMIKQMLFGKYFINKIAGYNTYPTPTTAPAADFYNMKDIEPLGRPDQLSFYDYKEEKTYIDEYGAGKPPIAVMNYGEFSQIQKNFYLIQVDIQNYADSKSYGDFYDIPNGKDYLDIQNHIAYMKEDVSEPIDVNEFNSIWKKVLGTTLSIKLLETYKKHHRTYEDLLKGKPAYSEDVAYKIEKHCKRTGETDDKYVLSQNFIVPNTSDMNVFNYVDTQVKYGTDMVYKYKIYAIKIVFGCAYNYFWPSASYHKSAGLDKAGKAVPATELQNATMTSEVVSANDLVNLEVQSWHDPNDKEGGAKGFHAKMGVNIFPDIVMLEDLFYESPEIIISDHPPVSPDVNIVPYRAKSDKILILLNGMVDTYREEPIEILPTDAEKFNFIKSAQLAEDGKIKFSSDDPVKKYEIFRTKNKPLSYTDFELYSTIGETHYVDKIKPNQKYYYTFRAIDGHGHISNPTEVYEVELVDDHGSVKPMIRIYNFEQPKYFESIKECQKYLMIKPNLKQLYYNPDKDEIDHMFNNSADAGFKRRFKLRITSKSTGKKMDLNINFSKKDLGE